MEKMFKSPIFWIAAAAVVVLVVTQMKKKENTDTPKPAGN